MNRKSSESIYLAIKSQLEEMPFQSLRDFAQELERRSELLHVHVPVDVRYELGAVSKKSADNAMPALIFENLVGFPNYRVATNIFATRSRLSLALGTTDSTSTGDLVKKLQKRINPIEEKSRNQIECKENIIRKEKVDLTRIPVPVWSEGDRHPYIDFGVFVSNDPDYGYNAGIARAAVVSKDTIYVWSNPQHHTRIFFENAKARGEKRKECAIVIGAQPSILIAASNDFAIGDSELSIAGALDESPIRMAQCETIDLKVPATSEIVIEGYFDTSCYVEEGPYGEFTGFQSPVQNFGLIFKATCISHRENPIHYCFYNGKPVTEHHFVWRSLNEPLALKELRSHFPILSSLNLAPEGCREFLLVLGIDKVLNFRMYKPGYVKNLLLASVAHFPRTKFVVAVDDDVDVRSMNDLVWAMSTHVRPDRDISTVNGMWVTPLDPSSDQGLSAKVFIDATTKKDFNAKPTTLPTDIVSLVEKKWSTYGIESEKIESG